MTKLGELTRVIRSKNAGPYMVALDIVFDKKESWERVVKSGVIGRAIPSGNFGDAEVLGSQYGPLYGSDVPD
jgi:hypothetical protein